MATKNAYRITLRHGGEFTLHSENDLHTITDKITVTPGSVYTAPYWVFDNDTAIFTADIVAIELIEPSQPSEPPREPDKAWHPQDRIKGGDYDPATKVR